jgi:hypothetical protein
VGGGETVIGITALAFDLADEDGGAEDTVDVTGVIPEEDTTERRKGADEVCFPGHRCLDACDIAGGVQLDRPDALLRRVISDGLMFFLHAGCCD